jgi:hypothetical protein
MTANARLSVLTRVLLAALLGVSAALIVACGSSTKGLIPAGSATPLQNDVDAVEAAAGSGNGDCGPTEAAIVKLEQDYAALPQSVNGGLRNNLHQGVSNLHKKALEACAEPLAGTTGTTTTATTKTETTPPATTTAKTETTPPEENPVEQPSESHGEGGGTPAPGEGATEATPGASEEGSAGGAGAEAPK